MFDMLYDVLGVPRCECPEPDYYCGAYVNKWEPPIKEFLDYYSQDPDAITSEVPPSLRALSDLANSLAASPKNGDAELLVPFSQFLREFCPSSANYNAVQGEGREFLNDVFESDRKPLKFVARLAECVD